MGYVYYVIYSLVFTIYVVDLRGIDLSLHLYFGSKFVFICRVIDFLGGRHVILDPTLSIVLVADFFTMFMHKDFILLLDVFLPGKDVYYFTPEIVGKYWFFFV